MSQGKRGGKIKGMTRVAARRDETRLPDWLYHTLTPHEPGYNPTLQAGILRRTLIWITAAYPKTCCLLLLAVALLDWAGFLALSTRLSNEALIGLTWLELPLVICVIPALWPLLLYRLTGLPKPAARPNSRSETQTTARLFYNGSCLTWFFFLSVIGVAWLWLIIYVFSLSNGGTNSWVVVGIGLICLPGLVFFIRKIVKEAPRGKAERRLPSQRVRLPQVKLKPVRRAAPTQQAGGEQAHEG